MSNTHGDFIWYELMTPDPGAAQAFYRGLFGWSFADSGMPEMTYLLFSAEGTQVGGVMGLTGDMQKGGARALWAGYISVDDVDDAASKLRESGGQVHLEPRDIPGVGRFAFGADQAGAPFYIMTDTSGQKSESFSAYTPRNGHCAWNELMTPDLDAAQSFYGDLFGWVKADSMDMGPMGEYRMLKNGASRDFMFGAMMKQPPEMPAPLWFYYFRAPDIDVAAAYVKDKGGAIINGPMEIPGGDFVFTAIDPQGALFSLIGQRRV
ncbi:MAG: VOC family protein [Terricaulis sp.]